MEVARGAAESADLVFDFGNLVEHWIITACHSCSPVQSKGQAETETLNHGHGVHSDLAGLTKLETFFDKVSSLNVQMVGVSRNRWLVQRRSCSLSSSLKGIVERRGTNRGTCRVG